MAVQVLYSMDLAVIRFNCFSKKQLSRYLWSLDVDKNKLITVADLQTMHAVSGTRSTLVDALGKIGELDELFN